MPLEGAKRFVAVNRLLRHRGERPSGRRAGEERYEFAPPKTIRLHVRMPCQSESNLQDIKLASMSWPRHRIGRHLLQNAFTLRRLVQIEFAAPPKSGRSDVHRSGAMSAADESGRP